MRTLRIVGRVALLLLVALVLSNALVPAVARAQFAASGGGSAVDVVAALLGEDVTATSFTATAASGSTGLGCQSNGCRIDYGAGAADFCTSDGITVTCGFSLALGTGQSMTLRTIGSQGGDPIQSVASGGFQFFPLALPGTACGSGNIGEGTLQVVPASTGVASKPCMCLKDSVGVFAWTNIRTGTAGTTTTCP